MSKKTLYIGGNIFENLSKEIPMNCLIDLIGSGELFELNYKKMDDKFKCEILKQMRAGVVYDPESLRRIENGRLIINSLEKYFNQ